MALSPRVKFCVALFLLFAFIVGGFVVVLWLTTMDGNLTRRIFQQITPCPFGQAPPFTIVEHHRPTTPRSQPATFLFSSCLFGNLSRRARLESEYLQPYLDNMARAQRLMPEAQMRLYVSHSLRDVVLPQVVERGGEVVLVSPDSKGFEGTLWRFFPADEDLPFMSLDMDHNVVIDATLVALLRHWLHQSPKQFFLCRTLFSVLMPIMAGRIAMKPKALPFSLKEKIETYCDTGLGVDEAFLNRELGPYLANNVEADTPLTAGEVGAVVYMALVVLLALAVLYWGCHNTTPTKTTTHSRAPRRQSAERYPLGW